MLNLQQEIINNLNYSYTEKERVEEDAPDPTMGKRSKEVIVNKEIKGRDTFHYLFEQHEITFKHIKFYGMRWLLKAFGFDAYEDNFGVTYFDHYFRHLYTILKFVHNTDFLSFNEKYKYTSILRSTLSRYELVWIYYNCLSSVGCEKFKPLVEEYSLLKNMRTELLTLNGDILGIQKLEEIKNQLITILPNTRYNLLYGSSNAKEIINQAYKPIINKFRNTNLHPSDYLFYITSVKGDTSKYHISAFYHGDEDLKKGHELIEMMSNIYI